MIVVVTETAEADLERIGDYIAVDNPVRALSFVQAPRERCEGLAEMPRLFPLVPRYEHLGIRRRIHGSYLIFYRIVGDTIQVLHVLHSAMNYEAILFPPD